MDTLKLQGFSQLELVSLQLATKIDPPKNTLLLWMRKLKDTCSFLLVMYRCESWTIKKAEL